MQNIKILKGASQSHGGVNAPPERNPEPLYPCKTDLLFTSYGSSDFRQAVVQLDFALGVEEMVIETQTLINWKSKEDKPSRKCFPNP